MTTEEIVRRVLADDRHAMPPWADPVARVRAGIRRRRRRRVAVVAVAGSVVVALVAVSTALAGRPVADPPRPAETSEPPEVIVPWVNQPVARPTSFARLNPGPTPNRPCEDADLSNGWVETERPRSGPWIQTIVVENESQTACTLDGSADVRGRPLAAADSRITMPAARTGPVPMEGAGYPAHLPPSGLARVDVAMRCDPRITSPAPDLAEPSLVAPGIEVSVQALSIRPDCTITIGDWYWFRPLLNAPLSVAIEAPSEVRRGETFTYQVTVINTLERPMALEPCPVYQQRLGDRVEWHRLNCALARLPAHRPVSFQMRMTVPADAPDDQARLSWMAVTGDGRVAIANMDTGGVLVQITG